MGEQIIKPTLETSDTILSSLDELLVDMETTLPNSPIPTPVPAPYLSEYPVQTGNHPSSDQANIISQSQEFHDDASIGSNNEDISAEPFSVEHDNLTAQLNNSVDIKDDCLAVELAAIISHRTVSGVLEFEVEYMDGEQDWYQSDLVISEDPQAAAQYVTQNDLERVSNDK